MTDFANYSVRKVMMSRSRNGFAMSCDLLCAGKLVARVIDEGRGGIWNFEWLVPGAEVALARHCATLPSVDCGGTRVEMDAELFVNLLVEYSDSLKHFAKVLKSHVVYVVGGAVKQVKADASQREKFVSLIQTAHADAQFLSTPEAVFAAVKAPARAKVN